LTAGVRADIAVQAAESGGLSNITVDGVSTLKGKYVDSVGVSTGGIITASFTGGVLNGKTMKIEPEENNGQIQKWTCSPGDNNGLDTKYIPSGCKE